MKTCALNHKLRFFERHCYLTYLLLFAGVPIALVAVVSAGVCAIMFPAALIMGWL